MPESVSKDSNFPVRAEKGYRCFVISDSSSDACSITVSISLVTTNFSDKNGMSYHSKLTLNGQSLKELKWWLENIQLSNVFFSHKHRSCYRLTLAKRVGENCIKVNALKHLAVS